MSQSQRDNYSLSISEIRGLINAVKLSDLLTQLTARLPKNKGRLKERIERRMYCMRVFVSFLWLSYLGTLLRGARLYIDFQGLCFVSEVPGEKRRTVRRYLEELINSKMAERREITFERKPTREKGVTISPRGIICAEAFFLLPFRAKKYTRSQYCFRIKTIEEYMSQFGEEAKEGSKKILNILKEVDETKEISEQFAGSLDCIKSFLPKFLEDSFYTIPHNLIQLMKEYQLLKKNEEEAFEKMLKNFQLLKGQNVA